MSPEMAITVEGEVGRAARHADGLDQRLDAAALHRALDERLVGRDRASEQLPAFARQHLGRCRRVLDELLQAHAHPGAVVQLRPPRLAVAFDVARKHTVHVGGDQWHQRRVGPAPEVEESRLAQEVGDVGRVVVGREASVEIERRTITVDEVDLADRRQPVQQAHPQRVPDRDVTLGATLPLQGARHDVRVERALVLTPVGEFLRGEADDQAVGDDAGHDADGAAVPNDRPRIAVDLDGQGQGRRARRSRPPEGGRSCRRGSGTARRRTPSESATRRRPRCVYGGRVAIFMRSSSRRTATPRASMNGHATIIRRAAAQVGHGPGSSSVAPGGDDFGGDVVGPLVVAGADIDRVGQAGAHDGR